MQVICSQMDFTHCRSLTFSKLSVGKEYISKPFFFFWPQPVWWTFQTTVLYISILLSAAAHPSILSWDNGGEERKTMGGLGGRGRRGEGQGVWGEKRGLYRTRTQCEDRVRAHIHTNTHTYRQAKTQTEGWWLGWKGHIGQWSGSLYPCVCVSVCMCACVCVF